MPSLWSLLRGKSEDSEQRYSLEQWAADKFAFNGHTYPLYGMQPRGKTESIETNFAGLVQGAYKSDGIIYACMVARQLVFSQAPFAFQKMEKGRGADVFADDKRLDILKYPWPGGYTCDLLSRAMQDVDLAGTHYVVREGSRLRRLRPDWVEIILTAPPEDAIKSDIAGFKYTPGGPMSKAKSRLYLPHQVAYWAPIPDPEAQFRGMSWLQPVLEEILSDKGATRHKKKFFDNAATPNISVALKETVTQEQFSEFMKAMDQAHQGVDSAYKTLYLGGGADVKVIGANLQQMDFKVTQGAGETRIAAAARVHPVIVGLSEGMQGSSLNAGNFKVAKDSFGDQFLRPMWQSICYAYSNIIELPRSSRLWYDDRDIPFLRTDQVEKAQVQQREASVIRTLIDGGFKPESIVEAIRGDDWTLLEHTGLVSVQLLPPGTLGGPGGGGKAPGDDQGGGGLQPGRQPGGAKPTIPPDVNIPKPGQGGV